MTLPKGYNYKPMPEGLFISDSDIEGKGVFAGKDLESNYTFITHETHYQSPEKLIRTRLGSYLNHSESPNCKLVKIGEYYYVKTIRPIKRWEELTVEYSLHKCGSSDINYESQKCLHVPDEYSLKVDKSFVSDALDHDIEEYIGAPCGEVKAYIEYSIPLPEFNLNLTKYEIT